MSGYNPKFDKDLKFGEAGENWLVWLGSSGAKVEVKTERDTWKDTGNLVFEFKYKGNKSGIAKTEADWWVHLLSLNDKIVGGYIFPVPALRSFLRDVYRNPDAFGCRIVDGGDGKYASMILVPRSKVYLITEPRPTE